MPAAVAATAGAALAMALAAPGGPGEDRARVAADRGGPPDGLLVLAVLDPERVMVADPRTGAATARELPGGTLCHGPVLAAGGRVLYIGSRRDRFVALSAPLGRLDRTRSLGPADAIAPSATPGRVWLGRWSRLDERMGRMALREAGAGARAPARRGEPLPRWAGLVAAVDGGLLVSRGRRLVLRRPGLPPVRIRDGWPLAAGGARFAWCPPGCRRLGVWDGERRLLLEPPRGVRPDNTGQPALSPGGERLALPVTAPGGARVAVVDLRRRSWSIVPGARLAGYKATAWSPSGRWLYFTGRGRRLLASRDGSGRPVRLPVRTGGTVMSIAAVARTATAH